MSDVIIVVESLASTATAQMVSAFKDAILDRRDTRRKATVVEVMTVSELKAVHEKVGDRVLCPLTLNLPEALPFAAQALYATCRDTEILRQQLADWQYATGEGTFWLPIVLTVKGALYAEVIGLKATAAAVPPAPEPCYEQPIHLSDRQRQPLYALAQRLLRSLKAPPAVYLLQFSWQNDALCFDRLLPFPAAPAIASLNIQTPDLFTCHWLCLMGQPIVDLAIVDLAISRLL